MYFKRLFTVMLCMLAIAVCDAQDLKKELVWSDEFDYKGLPDASKWDYEVGYVRNKEAQYYTKQRKKNASVKKGYLTIQAVTDKFKNPGFKEGSDDWRKKDEYVACTSASIITEKLMGQQYGRVEVRAKLPAGKGVWPAIWMMGTDRSKVGWPRCGEIDIMEYVGKDANTIYGTIHYADKDGKYGKNGGNVKKVTPTDGFHVYAIEWHEDRIDFFYDDTKYHTSWLNKLPEGAGDRFRKPFYLLINLAMGGSWGGEIDPAVYPVEYIIDYVRVYDLKE
ncbi:glycoside hydrolase family 16 protein [Puteibacter caeruleilacunae]|nr:glycoside hydrolase family 16 protein [Puteibacter caeruleilacunae]